MCGFDSDFSPECKSKSISGCFIHQAGIFGVKCFSILCGLILADSKMGEILMPNDLIALGFCSNVTTKYDPMAYLDWTAQKCFIFKMFY